MVKDPVCGMEVSEKGSLGFKYKGKTYHFCSQNCLNNFKSNPKQFV